MDQELKPEEQQQQASYKEKEVITVSDPAAALSDSAKALAKFGGFTFIEKSIKMNNLNYKPNQPLS